jgi:L-rhamnose mutarotase
VRAAAQHPLPDFMSASTETIAFRMRLNPGQAEEYRRRHDAIWPELVQELLSAGVLDYRIFLDEKTLCLFAVLTRLTHHSMDELPGRPIMKRWWAMMADIMETNPDNSPVVEPLSSVFHLAGPVHLKA